MKRIIAIVWLCLLCFGCQPPPAQEPVWENVKFSELRSPHKTKDGQNPESMLQFKVYTFLVPADNLAGIKEIWTNLLTKQMHFNNPELFEQNGFVAGFGQAESWKNVAKKLRAAESKNLKTIDLIIPDNNTDHIFLLENEAEKNIFYKAQGNQVSGVTLGKGELALRVTASTIPDMRGVCRVTVEPSFHDTTKHNLMPGKPEEIIFNTASLNAKMTPGDFILLGPANYTEQDMTLAGVFFSVPDKSAVQLYLIMCAGVNN